MAYTGIFLLMVTIVGTFLPRYYYHFIHGLPGNRNWNGSLLLTFLPFTLYFLYGYFRKTGKLSLKTSLFFLLLPTGAGIYVLTHIASLGTLAGMITAAFFLLLYFLPDQKWRKRVFVVSCVIVFITFFAAFFHQDKLLPLLYRSGSAGERIELYKSAFSALFSDAPIAGNAFAAIEEMLTGNRSEEYFKVLNPAIRSPHPHNHFLYVMLGWGIIGGFVLWGVFLVIYPVLKSFFTLAEERGKTEEKLLLLVLIMLLTHAQMDLILEVWPNGAITLLLLGLCWEKCFFSGRILPDGKKYFSGKGKSICIFTAFCILFFPMFLAGRKLAVIYVKERLFHTKKMDLQVQKKYMETLAFLASSDPEILYDLLLLSLRQKDPAFALSLSGLIRESAVPNYARIHSARGEAYIMQGDVEHALEEYRLDAERYPLAVLPIFNMAGIAERNHKKELLFLLQKEFERR